MLSYPFGDGEALAGRDACLFNEADIGLDQCLDAADPGTAVGVLGLVGELVCRGDVLERGCPAARQPLDLAQNPQAHHLGAFVSAGLRRLGQRLEHGSRPLDLAPGDEESAVFESGAGPVLKVETEAFLKLQAPLEEARRDLSGVGLGQPDPGDRMHHQPRISDTFSPLECSSGVGQPGVDVRRPDLETDPVGEDAGLAFIVSSGVDERLVSELEHSSASAAEGQHKLEQHINTLHPGGDLDEQPLEDRLRPVVVTGQAVQLRRLQPPSTRRFGVSRVETGGELEQLGSRRRRPPGGGMLGSNLQLGRHRSVSAFHGEGKVSGPLLDVGDGGGQRPMHGTAFPQRRMLVADRHEQRMGEPDPCVVDLDHPLDDRSIEGVEHTLLAAVRRNNELYRRASQRRNLEQHVPHIGRQAGETGTEQLLQACRHTHRCGRRRTRLGPHELAAQLHGKERVPRRDPVQAEQLGS